ncbi:hypothetical protein C8R47DRAFT_1071667 [Mycena vitilis]|nr:hypothetical protein C8R47DRAFT_1071667 [Mycena vitilis]
MNPVTEAWERLSAAIDCPPPPPALLPAEIWTRTPCLPWHRQAENVIQFDVSPWKHAKLRGLRRQPNSTITQELSRTYCPEAPNHGLVRNNNPFLKPATVTIPGMSAADSALVFAHQGVKPSSNYKRGRYPVAAPSGAGPAYLALPNGVRSVRSDGDRAVYNSRHAAHSGSLLNRLSAPTTKSNYSSTSSQSGADYNSTNSMPGSPSGATSHPKFTFGSVVSLPLPTEAEREVEDDDMGMVSELKTLCNYENDYISSSRM